MGPILGVIGQAANLSVVFEGFPRTLCVVWVGNIS